jgi:hypothetical protein
MTLYHKVKNLHYVCIDIPASASKRCILITKKTPIQIARMHYVVAGNKLNGTLYANLV